MSCCGKKRQDWSRNMQPAAGNNKNVQEDVLPKVSREPYVFEYTGLDLLILKGVVTGKNYYFKYPGAQVAVVAEDAWAMLAEPQLAVVRGYKAG